MIDSLTAEILLLSRKFYKHIDGGVVCKKCELTPDEGCEHAKISITVGRK